MAVAYKYDEDNTGDSEFMEAVGHYRSGDMIGLDWLVSDKVEPNEVTVAVLSEMCRVGVIEIEMIKRLIGDL